jgi:hypothetical protein
MDFGELMLSNGTWSNSQMELSAKRVLKYQAMCMMLPCCHTSIRSHSLPFCIETHGKQNTAGLRNVSLSLQSVANGQTAENKNTCRPSLYKLKVSLMTVWTGCLFFAFKKILFDVDQVRQTITCFLVHFIRPCRARGFAFSEDHAFRHPVRDTSVGKVIDCKLDGRSSIAGRAKDFSTRHQTEQNIGSFQPPMQWLLDALSPEVRWPERVADHS